MKANAEFRTESFEYNGYEIVYDVYGHGDELVIYMHGLLLDSDLNRGIAKALADRGSKVVLVDLLGHGRSDKPTHASVYRIDSYAAQVFALMDHLGASEAVLGGLSLGANVSLCAAGRQPERVRGLILEMPVLERAVPSAALLFAPLVILLHYGRPVLRTVSRLFGRVPDSPFGPANSFLHAAALPPDAMAAVLHGVLVGPVAPTMEDRSALEVPALVLAHANDLIHPFNDAAKLASTLPNGTLLRARSPAELRLRPARLTEEIAGFVDAAWSARSSGRRRAAGPLTT